MAKPKYEMRNAARVIDEVRFQVANHTGKKKSHVTVKTRLNHLDGDGIFDVMHALHDAFGIEIPSGDVHEDLVCKTVQALVDFVMSAPMAKPKQEKAGSKKSTQSTTKAKVPAKGKYPELAVVRDFKTASVAADVAAEAIRNMKDIPRQFLFTLAGNEVQLRDAKSDSIIAIIEVIADHRQVGFNLLHFQHMADTLEDTVLMASFTLGTPYTIARRFEMAARMQHGGRTPVNMNDMEDWAVDTLVQRMAFFPMIAPRLKKLVGTPKADHVEIVSEIANIAGFEFEDEVFDVYTNINKLEPGDEGELAASLDAFFNQEFFLEDAPKPKVCAPVQIQPTATPDTISPIDEEQVDYATYDKMRTIPTPTLALFYVHVYGLLDYQEVLSLDLPISSTRDHFIDMLVRDHDEKELANIAQNCREHSDVREIAVMLRSE